MNSEDAVNAILSRIENVRAVLDIAEDGDSIQFVQTAGMRGRIVHSPGFRPRDVFLAVLAELQSNFAGPDLASVRTALAGGKAVADRIANAFQLLSFRLGEFQDYYRSAVSHVEILTTAQEARQRLFDTLLAAHARSGFSDFNRLHDAWKEFIVSNVNLAEDVYRPDIESVTAVLPAMDDSPMAWPEPDEGELAARLPSEAERLPGGLSWSADTTDIAPLLPGDCDFDPIRMKDWIERLWGYSRRLVGPLRSNKQLVQVPRLVMYPFYDCFFELVDGLQRGAADLRKGRVGPLPASAVIRNPMDGFHLPWFMEKLLLFAPRAYFVEEDTCNHAAYLALASSLLRQTLTTLSTATAAFDTRDIAREVPVIIDHFDRFRRALCDRPACTKREYEQTARTVVAPFREHFLALSAALFALESEMAKRRPKTDNPIRRDLGEIKDGLTELAAVATDTNKFVHAKLGKTPKKTRTRNPARSKFCHELWLRNKDNELVLPAHAEPGTQITYEMVYNHFQKGLSAQGIENADMFAKAVKSGAKQAK